MKRIKIQIRNNKRESTPKWIAMVIMSCRADFIILSNFVDPFARLALAEILRVANDICRPFACETSERDLSQRLLLWKYDIFPVYL